MKKGLVFFGVLLFVWLLLTRADVKEKSSKQSQLTVLATTAMISDIVEQVGGDRVSVSVLIQGSIDPHSYELVKGDDEKIDAADIVFFNGLNLEHGASLQYKIFAHKTSVSVGDYILSKYPERILYEEGQLDPHIWMDVSLWSGIIDPIVETLSAKDPEGALYYFERGNFVREKMIQAHLRLKERLQQIPEKQRYLVTSHDAFGYFTRGYLASLEDLQKEDWKKRCAAPEGLAPDGQLSVIDLQKIVEYLDRYRVEVVFPETNVSRDSLKKILFACKEKNLSIRFSGMALYGDCMGDAASYLDMIEHNVSTLFKEWESASKSG